MNPTAPSEDDSTARTVDLRPTDAGYAQIAAVLRDGIHLHEQGVAQLYDLIHRVTVHPATVFHTNALTDDERDWIRQGLGLVIDTKLQSSRQLAGGCTDIHTYLEAKEG